ncbi:mu-type opioid receptor-like [Antedon mediterranea]|uniref:mu-type opioid receptor-like n=1 Tax=Antedon mediterranea TaxID=105859 RepID=UPI003AF7E514
MTANLTNITQLKKCTMPDIYESDVADSKTALKGIFISLVIICVLIVFGNTVVVSTFLHYRKLRRPRNIFVFNLALTDLSAGLMMPIQVLVGASVTDAIGSTFVVISLLTVLAIAVERFIIIVVAPTKHRDIVTKRGVITTCVCFWVIPLAIIVPFSSYTEAYILIVLNLGPWLMIFVSIAVVILYGAIFIKIRRHERRMRGKSGSKRNELREAERVVKAFALIVALFSACWLPWAIEALRINFSLYIITHEARCFRGTVAFYVCLCIGLLNSALNPLAYWWRLPDFRQGVVKLIHTALPCYETPEPFGSHSQKSDKFPDSSRRDDGLLNISKDISHGRSVAGPSHCINTNGTAKR